MTDVNVTELRQNLPAYLAKARKGQHIRVTSRGRVIAELGPPSTLPDHAATARARLRDSLVRFDDPFGPMIDPDEWDMER
ncbi:MAG: type II toxin-antitoxin system prevent-host-death family antitoxin [Candidatus Binatia bacterium]